MCIIIDKPKGVSLLPGIIARSIILNPDGAGFFIDGQIIKTFDVRKTINLLLSKERYTAHLRVATAGSVTAANIHPFYINENERLFHNGTVGIERIGDETDSAATARLLGRLPREEWANVLSLSDSRFAVANLATDKTTIYNPNRWTTKYKCRFSKTNVIESDFVFVRNEACLKQMIGVYAMTHVGNAFDDSGNRGALLMVDDVRRLDRLSSKLGERKLCRILLSKDVSFKAYSFPWAEETLTEKEITNGLSLLAD
jgi:hypothetical protein